MQTLPSIPEDTQVHGCSPVSLMKPVPMTAAVRLFTGFPPEFSGFQLILSGIILPTGQAQSQQPGLTLDLPYLPGKSQPTPGGLRFIRLQEPELRQGDHNDY